MAKDASRQARTRLAVEYMIQQSEVACRVPAEVRQALEKRVADGGRDAPSIDQVWREADLRGKYNVTLGKWREHMRFVQTLRLGMKYPRVAEAIELAMRLPVEQIHKVQDASNTLLFSRLAQMVEDPELTPADLAQLADALARANASVAKISAERLARTKFERGRKDTLRDRKRKEARQDVALGDHVQRIYGTDTTWAKGDNGGQGDKGTL